VSWPTAWLSGAARRNGAAAVEARVAILNAMRPVPAVDGLLLLQAARISAAADPAAILNEWEFIGRLQRLGRLVGDCIGPRQSLWQRRGRQSAIL
jgi:hypothetical protein